MSCQRCGMPIQQTGSYMKKFCSRSCANVRSFSEESNRLRSKSNREAAARKSLAERQQLTAKAIEARALKRASDLQHGVFDALSASLKRERILLEQDGRCLECGILPEWNGRQLKFQLDHVNGDRSNNTRDNLRLLCPNCHSQTETYCGGNQRRVDDGDLLQALKTNDSTLKALESVGLQPGGKNYKRAERLIADVG